MSSKINTSTNRGPIHGAVRFAHESITGRKNISIGDLLIDATKTINRVSNSVNNTFGRDGTVKGLKQKYEELKLARQQVYAAYDLVEQWSGEQKVLGGLFKTVPKDSVTTFNGQFSLSELKKSLVSLKDELKKFETELIGHWVNENEQAFDSNALDQQINAATNMPARGRKLEDILQLALISVEIINPGNSRAKEIQKLPEVLKEAPKAAETITGLIIPPSAESN